MQIGKNDLSSAVNCIVFYYLEIFICCDFLCSVWAVTWGDQKNPRQIARYNLISRAGSGRMFVLLGPESSKFTICHGVEMSVFN